MAETGKMTLQVNLLGALEILDPETGAGGKVSAPKLQQQLLACLIMRRTESISAAELIEVLYSNSEEEMLDPLASLRGLIFRMRAQLKKTWGAAGAAYVLTDGSDYRWNPEVKVELDIDRFTDLLKKAEADTEVSRKILHLRKALEQYKGPFLNEIGGLPWIIHRSVYYRTMYLDAVTKLLALLKEEGLYEEMRHQSQLAQKMEPLEEELYVSEMEALMGMKDFKGAQDVYRHAVVVLYEHLGNSVMPRLEQAHEELMKRAQIGQASIGEAIKDLQKDRMTGAFFCDYGVFREIYQLEERRSERLGVSVYLAMISGEVRISSRVKDEQYRRKVLADGMRELQEVMIRSLRSGDVLTRFSDSQYLLLLPTCQYETAMKVLERVEQAFNKSVKVRNVFLHFAIKEI